ncbi:LppU family putative lipoprotein [Nocardia bovistercoris]|uniref:LppU protein n=1 Tax=Nocardia bovistercoris TaxID=2785916 RepID=A0A931N409_9NOCA|nr:hypothetical protein [Nocardia bovistercoris]MBH0778354.1 hypothetical protein [Nocardia bovistercoris]
MPRRRLRATIILTGIVVAAAVSTALVAAAVLTTSADTAPVESHDAAVTSTLPLVEGEAVAAPEPAPPLAVGMRGNTEKSTAAVRLGAGDCVRLDSDGIGKTACGAGDSRYKIIDTVAAADRCPSDADRVYDGTLRGSVGAALCLDIDWVVGGCVDLVPHNPRRVDCAAPATADTVRVLTVRDNTASPDSCKAGDHGIVYRERRFVVCVTRL